jgi:hypothetical protein
MLETACEFEENDCECDREASYAAHRRAGCNESVDARYYARFRVAVHRAIRPDTKVRVCDSEPLH